MEQMHRYANNVVAESTRRQYGKSWEYYLRFCVAFGLQEYVCLPNEGVVTAFATYLAETQRFGTVRNTISGLKAVWLVDGIHVDFSKWQSYAQVMKGIRRCRSGLPNKKHAISPAELKRMAPLIPRIRKGAALWACVLITWWGKLRKSYDDTTMGFKNPMDPGACILVSDVKVDVEKQTMRIEVRKSKTNQFNERGHVIHIAGQRGDVLDPVGAWHHHLAVNSPQPHMPAFAFQGEHGWQPMLHALLVSSTKELVAAIGLDPHSVGGHSFRRGSASWAYTSGVAEMMIQNQGDGLSNAYKGYIVLSEAQQLQTSQRMADRIRVGRPDHLPDSASPAGHTKCS